MPRRKSNLNNACSKDARRKRIERNNRSDEQTTRVNEDQRIRTKVRRGQESQEHRDERLRQNAKATRKQHIDSIRAQEQKRQQTNRALKHASDIDNLAYSKIAMGAMNTMNISQHCQAFKFSKEAPTIFGTSEKSPPTIPRKPLYSLIAGESDDYLSLLN